QDFNLQDGITYIWTYTDAYGMKGTAYYGGPHYGEGWFVTPYFKLKKSKQPALSFDQAINYGPTEEAGRYTQVTVWVSTDYVDDVRTATWTQLPWNMYDEATNTGFPTANSWTFYNSGRMDLSAWNDQRICIGFRYKSEPDQTCSTWEVKNILVSEPEETEE
ncbi:MAG: choice-of-anchor J domain-containing protein, partial [Paludibacteraceae bacterium]|nr:choice-of-anchor J domain-containing protein [Paludibacteraceae bacterium]